MKSKLNVGSGKSYLPDYWNLELHPKFKADQYGDMRTVEFPDGSFEEILACDVIDHVTFVECKRLLRKFYRWLKPNGALLIHTPNLRFLAKKLSQSDDHESLMWMYGTDGEGSTSYETNVIRWAYSRESLTQVLTALGFTVLEAFEDCLGYGLNIIAIKKLEVKSQIENQG